MRYTDPIDPSPHESCQEPSNPVIDQSKYALPPVGQVVIADPTPDPNGPVTCPEVTSSDSAFTEWRLLDPLRGTAAAPGRIFGQPLPVPPPAGWDQRDPIGALMNAAAICKNGPIESQYEARALADLAVTGRLSYETLASLSFQTPADVVARMVSLGARASAATKVVARAQKVAWAIRGNPGWRAKLRPQLGWIGVSGEDDAPHRPCNVLSLPGPQFDIEVPGIQIAGHSLTVKTRMVIAENPWPPAPPAKRLGSPPTFLPPDDIPAVSPDSDYVFLYMAGDCSRAEEASDLIPALLTAAEKHGKQASVIAFDMIGWGYSARRAFDGAGNAVLFDPEATFADGQPLFPVVSYPDNPPALQFVEDFVVALLQTMNRQPPFLDLSRVVPIGGSLGGNLALRLGRRTDLMRWLPGVCSWSPASVWPSKASYPDIGTLAGLGAQAGADYLGRAGAAVGSIASGAGGLIGAAIGAIAGGAVGGVIGAVAAPFADQAAIDQCASRMKELEEIGSRRQHFVEIFDQDTVPLPSPLNVPAQADMWYRGGDWSYCKTMAICQDRLDRREVYDPTFRRWHWRISQEQLVYSHRDNDPQTGVPRYLLNQIPMLLAAGQEDDYTFANIYSWTVDLAQKMTGCPGTSLFLRGTGHSIHNERPLQLAHAIFEFLGEYAAPRSFMSLPWLSLHTGTQVMGRTRTAGRRISLANARSGEFGGGRRVYRQQVP
jgi:alpha-beta hydrolase superfamily lysophospholipase